MSEFKELVPPAVSEEAEAEARTRLRLKIGDSETDAQLLTDDELDVYIEAWPGNVELAAADAAEAIAAKFSRGFNFSTDGQTFNRRERVIHYTDLAASLRCRGGVFVWPTPEAEDEP